MSKTLKQLPLITVYKFKVFLNLHIGQNEFPGCFYLCKLDNHVLKLSTIDDPPIEAT